MTAPASTSTDPAPTAADPQPQPPQGDPAPDPRPIEPTDTTDWKAEARKHEKRAKDGQTALQKAQEATQAAEARTKAILKAAGIGDDEDPTEAAQRSATERDEATKRADAAEAKASALERKFTAAEEGRKAGANVEALLENSTFLKTLAELEDASSAEVAKAVKAALDTKPYLKAAPANATRSVTDNKGSVPEQPKRAASLSEAVKRHMGG